jgi:hypothetical protein
VVPRYKLSEHLALAALRQGALADGASSASAATAHAPDMHRGEAAAFEAAKVAIESHRRLGDAVEMMRRLMSRLERKGADTIYSPAWRAGYLRAANDAVQLMQRALTEEPFDSAADRRNSGEFRFEFSMR